MTMATEKKPTKKELAELRRHRREITHDYSQTWMSCSPEPKLLLRRSDEAPGFGWGSVASFGGRVVALFVASPTRDRTGVINLA
ncbi:MAG: hypothetical protein WBW80_17095 [Acidimicrobiales bacterium]